MTYFMSQKIVFILANSADPDEMPPNAAFHLGFECLQKYRMRSVNKTFYNNFSVISKDILFAKVSKANSLSSLA